MNEPHPSSPQTLIQAAPANSPQKHLTSRRFVRVAIIVVAVVFVTCVAIVYYKSWLNRQSVVSALLEVRGSSEFDGATVTVVGGDRPETGVLGPQNNYLYALHRVPGNYEVTVQSSDGGFTHPVKLHAGQHVLIDLPKTFALLRSTTRRSAAEKVLPGK